MQDKFYVMCEKNCKSDLWVVGDLCKQVGEMVIVSCCLLPSFQTLNAEAQLPSQPRPRPRGLQAELPSPFPLGM